MNWREQNYKVFLATGRSYSEISQLVPDGFTVDGIISSNGTSAKFMEIICLDIV